MNKALRILFSMAAFIFNFLAVLLFATLKINNVNVLQIILISGSTVSIILSLFW
jgi:hypothetical protein